MRILRSAALLALGCGGILVFLAAPAAADLSGPCGASGVFEKSEVSVDAKTNEVIEVEPEDEVSYTATVTGATPPRKTSGEVKVQMPFPFPDYKAGDWSDDDATDIEKVDTYTYDLPAIAPRGFDLEVSGFHQDRDLPKCEGSVTLRVKGGFFSSPAGPVSVVITALSAAGVVMAARPKVGV
jgi:hypothetical protein